MLTGVGWKNFASTNIDYYDKIEWVSLTDHTHSIFTHLLVEFGIVFGGAISLAFVYLLFKNFKGMNDPVRFYTFIILLAFIIYSLFEFPLWDFRYLFVFAIFFGFYTNTCDEVFTLNSSFFFVALLIITTLGVFYIFEYRKIATTYSVVINPTVSMSDKYKLISRIDSSVGLIYFKDLLLFKLINPDGFMLEESIKLGYRVTDYTPEYSLLIKQGTLLALDSKVDESLQYFELACKYDWMGKCEETKMTINELYNNNPKKFENIYLRFKGD